MESPLIPSSSASGSPVGDPADTPTVSVVMPCRNEVRYIEACLRSIFNQQAVPGGFEVLVVDGMSDDGTREVLARLAASHPQLRVIDNPRRFTASAMNLGIENARGQWIAILGCHNRYAEDYLRQCHQVSLETCADNVGGAMFCEGKTPMQRAVAAAHHSPFACGGAGWHDTNFEGPADTVFGGFYRREVFARIGRFDEELVRNQDDELNLRLVRAGGRIWHSPRIRSWYSPRATLRALFTQYLQYGYWKVRVIQKHRLPASWRHLVPGAFVFALGLLGILLLVGLVLGAGGQAWGAGAGASLARAWGAGLRWTAGGLLALGVASYTLAVCAAAALTAAKHGGSLFTRLIAVFPCYHLGYGYGFLCGIEDFLIRRRGPRAAFGRMNR